MTYADFLLLFLVLPLSVLVIFLRRRLLDQRYLVLTGILMLIALVYMAPWDHIAAVWGLWTWASNRTWGLRWWAIPPEEYLFCVLEALLAITLTYALPHEKSAFVLFTNPPPLEVVSTSASRSLLRSYYFAERTEIAIMCLLRQIFHEAIGRVAVVLSERFRIGPFQERQTWEKKRIFKAGVHCASRSPRSIVRPRLPRNACCWIPLP